MVVTLQSRQYVDEEFGERTFGARAEPVTQALRKARLEIWEIAAQAMRTEQLDALDYLIWDWRQRNPTCSSSRPCASTRSAPRAAA